jgi:ferric-dicitrate binding protein FerR (iron transport regulator)
MSPEQVRGHPDDITPRTDVYALGAILYELLAGRPPHEGETLPEVYRKIQEEDPAPAPAAGGLETVALTALAKEPARRYPTAAEFAEDLRRALDGEPVSARPEGRVARLWRRARRYRRLALVVAAAVAVGVAAGILAPRSRERAVATVESVQGSVVITGLEGRPVAQQGSTLTRGAGLATGAAPSRAILRLRSGAVLELGPVTFVRTADDGSLVLPNGTVSADSEGRPVAISTPHAEVRSEGGAFSVGVHGAATRVESKSGQVAVTRLRDGRRVALPAATAVRVVADGGPLEPAPVVDRVLRVGPGRPFAAPSDAAAAATDGAVVEIDAGLYEGDVAVWKANHLTIRGVGGRARVKGTGKLANGHALWVLSGRNTVIENLEFSGAAGAEATATGLWLGAPHATIRNCAFLDNHRSLTGPEDPESDLLIEMSEFVRNGHPVKQYSNLPCPAVRSVVIRHCDVSGTRIGHHIGSRARSTSVLYCRVDDEGSPASMLLDLPEGGRAVVVGNLLRRGGKASRNAWAVSFATGKAPYPDSVLHFVNNTVLDETAQTAIIGVGPGARAKVVNNVFSGKARAVSGQGELVGNLIGRDPRFVDPASGDYALREDSPGVDAGADPGTVDGFDLTPRFHPSRPPGKGRPIRGPLDLGAFEFSK